MAADHTLNHEYLPVAGNPVYRSNAVKLLLGDSSPAISENRVGLFTVNVRWGHIQLDTLYSYTAMHCQLYKQRDY